MRPTIPSGGAADGLAAAAAMVSLRADPASAAVRTAKGFA